MLLFRNILTSNHIPDGYVFIDGNLKTAITFEWMKLFGCSFHCYKAIENTHNVFACICFRGKGKIAKKYVYSIHKYCLFRHGNLPF